MDFDDTMTQALRRYARSVTSALGLDGDCWCVQGEHTAGVYLALEGRLASFPDHDVALLWDEDRGWSAVVETGGEDTVVEHLDGLSVPRPAAVAEWVTDLFRRSAAGEPVGEAPPSAPGNGQAPPLPVVRALVVRVPAPRSAEDGPGGPGIGGTAPQDVAVRG